MMSKTSRQRTWKRAFAGGLAGLTLVGALWGADDPQRSPWPFQSLGGAPRQPDDAIHKPAAEEATVKLHYSNAPWQKVLEQVAEQSGSTITLQDVPPGTFSRMDLAKYTRTDAIRILNRELEPLGHRILVKDDHLTVLDLHRARSTYRRPVSPDTSTVRNSRPEQTDEVTSVTQQRRSRLQQHFETITRSIAERRGEIVQTGGEEPASSNVVTGDHNEPGEQTQTSPQPTPAVANAPLVETVYLPKQRTAVELAQTVYRSFKSRSQLLDAGNNGLPAFRVYRVKPAGDETNIFAGDRSKANTWFTLEIDTDQNRLVLSAPENTARGLTNLISRLDVAPQEDAPATRVVQGTEATLHVARELQPELGRLQQARREHPTNSQQELAFQQAGDGQPPAAQPPAQQGPTTADGQPAQLEQKIPSALTGLRGEVTLEALDDLNLLILRGNEDDLKQVQEVIDMIEQLAVGTRPEIHLLFLNNVNSEALATLLSDVYQRLGNLRNAGTEQGSQTVNVVSIASPNAILILAPTNTMQSVIDLAEELDRPGDPRSEVQIFPLRNAVATQVVETLESFYEERTGLGPRIQATADVRTNTVIIHARPAELAEVRLIIRKMDRGSSNSKNQIRVVPLQQAAADELATFLTTTIQGILNPPTQQVGVGGLGGANQGEQALRATKAVVLEFLKHDGNAQELIRSGLLSDVRVTGDLRTNSLTVIAPEQTMKLMLELIDILDQPSAAIADIKVFTLKNADATAAADLLTQLFTPGAGAGAGGGNQAAAANQLGIAISGATDASSSLIPMKFSVDPRTNTVVAIGGLDALTVVEAILTMLDTSDLRQREQTVVKLRNTQAQPVADAINQFVQAQLNLVQIDPNRVSTNEIIDQTYIVVAEPTTNTLIISAAPRYFDQILKLAKDLDKVPPQVFISALLVEVDLLDTDEWGVELGFQDPVLFDRSTPSTLPAGGVTPGFNFNNFPLGTAAVAPGIVGTQGLSNFSLGRTNSDLGFGGLVLSASSDSVSVLLRALKARRNIRVLSAPKVHALDNQEALIQAGQLVPLISGVTQTVNSTSPNIVYQQTGLILTVLPRITPEGEVVMGVSAQKSALSGATVPVFFNSNNGSTLNAPIINQTIATTTVMVNDGQSVVLGGIIIDNDTVNERKVPYFGDLPYIGHAFRFDSHTHMRSELLIFLTPHIINDDADFELVKQVEAERVNFFEHEAEAVNGPLFSVPRPQPEIIYSQPYETIDPRLAPPGGDVVPSPTGELPLWELEPTPMGRPAPAPSPAPVSPPSPGLIEDGIQTLP